MDINYGQRAFSNSNVPSGYKALCASNLPEPTIADGSKYFDTKLYSGTGSAQSIGGFGFSPDLVWYKSRSNGLWHGIYDIVRGVNKGLFPNSTQAETTYAAVTGFNSDGFTIGTVGDVNTNSATYAAWAWDAGSSNTTIAAGSLNSSAYDQSQTWSNSLTSDIGFAAAATQAFDGNTSTSGSSNTGGTLTFAPNLTIPANSTIEGWFGYSSTDSGATMRVTVNGVVNNSVPGDSWRTLNYNGSTTLSSFTVFRDGSTNSAEIRAIRINGKILVDSGVSVTNVPSIASTVRANPSAGFSIVSYNTSNNYPTIGHGLNTEVEFIIAKSKTDGNAPWVVYTKTGGLDNYLMLNSTAASGGLSGAWGTSAFTSSTFSAGWNDYYSNRDNMIAYCFAPVAGYSAMGSYVGNGSADGPFVYTGFRPGWLMVKNASTSGETWTIYDAARDPHNLATNRLQPNASDAETSGTAARDKDFLSNGFKVRGTSGEQNTNGDTYIYLAFASNPFKNARAR
jgi:hypothetical protein